MDAGWYDHNIDDFCQLRRYIMLPNPTDRGPERVQRDFGGSLAKSDVVSERPVHV